MQSKGSIPWNTGLGRGRTRDGERYPQIRLEPGKWVAEHTVIVERVLGHKLPTGAEIHHVAYGENAQFVVCQDKAYHRFLHTRSHAYCVTGNAHSRKCVICKQWSDPELDDDLVICKRSNRANGDGIGKAKHRACHARAEYNRKNGGTD